MAIRGAAQLGMTGELADFAAGLSVSGLPVEVTAQAGRLLLDACCSMLVGSATSNAHRAVAVYSAAPDGRGVVVGHNRGVSAEIAALLNGISAHECGVDDFHAPTRTHPGAVVVPAVLAAAAESPDVSGDDVLAAIIVGYEVTARLSLAMGVKGLFARGFHPGAVCGSVGAAVAAARLMGLPASGIVAAIGLASSQASGLLTWEHDPTHTLKSFQVGSAARIGVTSAMFASGGYAPATDVLSGEHNLLAAFSDIVDLAAFADLGQTFAVNDMTIKRHAGCGQIHSSIDAVIDMRDEDGIRPDNIDRIDIELADDALRATDGTPLLTHNLQFVVSTAVHAGCVVPDHFREPWTSNVSVRELAARVHGHRSAELQERFPRYQSAVVSVRCSYADLRREVAMPHGGPAHPLSNAELLQKVQSLTGLPTTEPAEPLATPAGASLTPASRTGAVLRSLLVDSPNGGVAPLVVAELIEVLADPIGSLPPGDLTQSVDR